MFSPLPHFGRFIFIYCWFGHVMAATKYNCRGASNYHLHVSRKNKGNKYYINVWYLTNFKLLQKYIGSVKKGGNWIKMLRFITSHWWKRHSNNSVFYTDYRQYHANSWFLRITTHEYVKLDLSTWCILAVHFLSPFFIHIQ